VSLFAPHKQLIVAIDGVPAEGSCEGSARLLSSDSGPVYCYRCPVHGTEHTVPYAPGFARQYFVAMADRACCCPLTAPWSVRHGLGRMRLLAWLLIILWTANLGDLILTLRAVARGRATEVNRLMSVFLDAGSFPAALFKIGVVSAAVAFLWLLRRRRAVLPAAATLTLLFVALVAYEALSLASG
jgi:hypothetical protein